MLDSMETKHKRCISLVEGKWRMDFLPLTSPFGMYVTEEQMIMFHTVFFFFYLLVVLDLVFSAAAVRVGRLPPHQRYALLFDLLRPELTY